MLGLFSFVQDAAQGDSGAPLYTLGTETESEITGRKLIGIHSGGEDRSACSAVKKDNKVFYPKWWVRVAQFAKWIKCTQKNAFEGKDQRKVERKCDDWNFQGFPPKCNHTKLLYNFNDALDNNHLPYFNGQPFCT